MNQHVTYENILEPIYKTELSMLVGNSLHSGSNAHATNGGDNFLCNLPTSQRLNGNVDDMMFPGSGSAPMSLNKAKIENVMKYYKELYPCLDVQRVYVFGRFNRDIDQTDEEGCTLLYKAASRGRLIRVKNLLVSGADPNKASKDGRTALHVAAEKGYEDIVKFLVDKGADVNAECDLGQTALHAVMHNDQCISAVAVGMGHLNIVKYLIKQGSKIDKQDHLGYTPLLIAAAKGYLEIVKYLTDQKCSVKEFNNKGLSPLSLAAKHGQLNTVKYLADGKVDERAALNEARRSGHLDIVEFFTDRKHLRLAASSGHLEFAQNLVQRGVDINSCYEKGWTPLDYAIQNNNCEVIDYLLTNGAKANQGKEESPLYMASRLGHLDAVKVLISRGISVNAESLRGQIPLHAAAATGRIQVVETLIENGSDLNKTDIKGCTPLQAAFQNGHLEVVRYLIWKGAINIKYRGMTTLYIAAQSGNLDNHGSDATKMADNGCTPLHAAAHSGRLDVVQYLISHAAEDAGHQDVQQCLIRFRGGVQDERPKDTEKTHGMTPLQAAEDAGQQDVQECLIHSRTEVHDGRYDDTDKSFRSDENCPDMVRGSGMSKVSACDRLSGINGESYYPMPLKMTTAFIPIQNPRQTNPDSLSRHIKTTIRPTRESCVAKPKTQIYGGEVPAIDDLPINMENGAGDPKPEIKNPRRTNPETNPDSFSRHFKTTIRPTRISCVSKPKTKLHGGEVPATNNLTITNENDAVNPKPGIKSKRRNIENVFSIPTFLFWHYRMILALAFSACCPILVAGNLRQTEPVTLEAGTRGVVTFFLERPSSTHQFSLYLYTIQFGSKGRPFCIGGRYDVDGFKDPSQVSRFTTTVTDRDTSPGVDMTIDEVDTIDGDQYILTAVWHSLENVMYDTQKKEVFVHRPPGPADCLITLSDSEFPYELHCWAKTGSIPTTLTCFQKDQDLVKVHNITHNGHTTRAIFFLLDTTNFSCCSHGITSTVGAATCHDFEWPPGYSGIPSTEKTTSRSRSANRPSDPTTIAKIESNVGSGACSPSMIPSHWPFMYLFLYPLTLFMR